MIVIDTKILYFIQIFSRIQKPKTKMKMNELRWKGELRCQAKCNNVRVKKRSSFVADEGQNELYVVRKAFYNLSFTLIISIKLVYKENTIMNY